MDNAWHTITCTVAPSDVNLYIDGALSISNTLPTTLLGNIQYHKLGDDFGGVPLPGATNIKAEFSFSCLDTTTWTLAQVLARQRYSSPTMPTVDDYDGYPMRCYYDGVMHVNGYNNDGAGPFTVKFACTTLTDDAL
jgi:hypothetical protein